MVCTKSHSMGQGFASNALGSTPRMALRKTQRCTFDAVTFLPTVTDETRRPSTRRLWCGNAWGTEILSPSSISPRPAPFISERIPGGIQQSTLVRTDFVLPVPVLWDRIPSSSNSTSYEDTICTKECKRTVLCSTLRTATRT